jgi:hypothetical protein
VFLGAEIKETTAQSAVVEGQSVDIALTSPAIEFSPSVKKLFDGKVLHALFWGMAKDLSKPGEQRGLLAIKDASTGQELDSLSFTIEIVDYAFDHVSRPLIGKIASAMADLGAVASFALTFLEKIDKGFGLASGTAAMAMALFLLRHVSGVYRNPTLTTPPQGGA